eukprot:7795988-Ditylum_brightwellii.AAC.1
MVQLTLRHGICKESCIGLASLSFIMCEFEDFKASDHIGRLATLLLEKFKSEEYLPHVYALYIGGVRCWLTHSESTLEQFLHGYRVGMQTGGVDTAMLNAYLYLITSFTSGRCLVELGRELDLFGKQMIEYNQLVPSKMTLVIRHLVSNLVSSKDSLSLITDQRKGQEDVLEQAIKENDYTFICHIYIFGVIDAYIGGRYELAADMVIKRKEVEKKLSCRLLYYGLTDFFDGLTFLAMAHKTNDAKWGSFVSKAIETMK